MSDTRAAMHDLMVSTILDEQREHRWTYHAVRPMPVPAGWHPGQYVTGDCSKGVQYIAHWAHGPDPMGNGFGSAGNSQTIWLHLQHLDEPSELDVGDPVTFGPWGSEHAAMVLEKGPDPLLWSFGHQGAPNSYRLSYDRRPRQYLRLPIVYVPTPEDRLRARTGWFAWVAWKLGEGDWRHHMPADPKVRPNVPKRIPVEWWARYAQFIANRKRADKATA